MLIPRDRALAPISWTLDVLVAVALAIGLGSLTLGSVGEIGLARAWIVLACAAFGLLHVGVVLRRRAPVIAYGLGGLAMIVVIVVPNGRSDEAPVVDVPLLIMPSSLVFLVLLYAVAAALPHRLRAAALGVALLGAVLATIRAAQPLRDVYPQRWWVSLYVAGLLMLTVLVVWTLGSFQYVRRERATAERAESVRLAVLEERARIARDMHDIVAHSLAVIIRQAEGGAFAGERAPEKAIEALRVISDTGRGALDDMRGLLGVLRDPPVAGSEPWASNPDGGPHRSLDDLQELIARVRDAGVDVEYEPRGAPYDAGGSSELAAYRVVQEALTNTLKHVGPGARARVLLEWRADEFSVQVSDDGPPGASHSVLTGAGSGLRGLRERVVAAGGDLTIHGTDQGLPDSGFTVRAAFRRRGPQR
jgi:signal transduction histidine kinase